MLQIWVGGWGGQIVIPMPEALSFAESRRQKQGWRSHEIVFVYWIYCIKILSIITKPYYYYLTYKKYVFK
jgi:hypothetical protein